MYLSESSIELFENSELFSAFPNPDEVFLSSFEKEVLLPVGMLRFNIRDKLHSVLVAAPLCDEQGRIGKRAHGARIAEFWLTYSLKDGRWGLDCSRDELYSFQYKEALAMKSFMRNKEFFQRNGFLQWDTNKEPDINDRKSLFDYGGLPLKESNWFYQQVCNDIPHLIESTDEEPEDYFDSDGVEYVVLHDVTGHSFIYLGNFNSCYYSQELTSTVHVFYCIPKSRVLVITEYT